MFYWMKLVLILGKVEIWYNEILCCGWKFYGFFLVIVVSKKELFLLMVCMKVVFEMISWRLYFVVDVWGLLSVNGNWKRCKFLLVFEWLKKVMLCLCYFLYLNLIEFVW